MIKFLVLCAALAVAQAGYLAPALSYNVPAVSYAVPALRYAAAPTISYARTTAYASPIIRAPTVIHAAPVLAPAAVRYLPGYSSFPAASIAIGAAPLGYARPGYPGFGYPATPGIAHVSGIRSYGHSIW